MAIAEGISAAKLALDAGKVALDLLRHPKIDGEAVRNKIVEMHDLVFSAQRSLADAEDENRELKRELHKMLEKQALKESLIFADEVYMLRRDDGMLDGPFCPPCWDIDGKMVRLIRDLDINRDGVSHRKYGCITHIGLRYIIGEAKFRETVIGPK